MYASVLFNCCSLKSELTLDAIIQLALVILQLFGSMLLSVLTLTACLID